MKKAVLILSFILVSVVSFAQRQRTTAMFDADTTTRPKTGFYGIGIRSNNIYFVPTTGNNIKLANYSLFTGLTTNYYVKWNGSKFVNTMMYDNGTNVGINTTSPGSLFDVRGQISASTGSLTNPAYSFVGDLNTGIYSSGADALALVTGGVNRLHINSSGSVGIGTTSLTGFGFRVGKQITGSTTAISILQTGEVQADVTGAAFGVRNDMNIAASVTLPAYTHFDARQGSIGASTALATQTGFVVSSNMTSGATNYGFRGQIPSGANRWNLYMDGTAQNYLSGNLGIGVPVPTKKLDVNGEALIRDLLTINSTVTNEGGQVTLRNPTNYTKSFAIDNYQDSFRIINDTDGFTALSVNSSGSIAIGTTTANASSILDIPSTTKGVLLPRQTTTQINAISGPANGLMVYNTTLNKLCVYENGTWKQVATTNM